MYSASWKEESDSRNDSVSVLVRTEKPVILAFPLKRRNGDVQVPSALWK